jgi:uracil-DNA glycosylase
MRYLSKSVECIHPQWRGMLEHALLDVDPCYLQELEQTPYFYPDIELLFAAFSHPLSSVRYILLGESPYPRASSANGYAFWDASVSHLWSATGLSKDVNRATSLRNFIKMLLHARGDLKNDFSQQAIARLDKSKYLQTAPQLFGALIHQGFLLLNASLVYSEERVSYNANHWRPFMRNLLQQLATYNPDLKLILFGRIAATLVGTANFSSLIAEHPYNLSFITNSKVLDFFRPMNLLRSNND